MYIDLYQTRDIDLAHDYSRTNEGQDRIVGLIDTLRPCIDNDGVLSVIRIWLSTCGLPRDHSGLPEIGVSRKLDGASVRTISEMFIERGTLDGVKF